MADLPTVDDIETDAARTRLDLITYALDDHPDDPLSAFGAVADIVAPSLLVPWDEVIGNLDAKDAAEWVIPLGEEVDQVAVWGDARVNATLHAASCLKRYGWELDAPHERLDVRSGWFVFERGEADSGFDWWIRQVQKDDGERAVELTLVSV